MKNLFRARLVLLQVAALFPIAVIDAFVLPTQHCLPYRVNIPERSSSVRIGVEIQEENSGGLPMNPPPPVKRRAKLWSKLLAVAVTTMTAVSLKRLPVPTVVGNARVFRAFIMSLVSAWALLTLFWRATPPDGPGDDVGGPGTGTNAWVNDRLVEVEEIDRRREERMRMEAAEREAERIALGKKWASATLQSAKEAREQAERERKRMEEERRRAELWLDSTSRGGLIDLEGISDPEAVSDDDEDNRTIDSNERTLLSLRSGDRGNQLWMENAVKRSGVNLKGVSGQMGRSSAGGLNLDESSGLATDSDLEEEGKNSDSAPAY